jgi:cobalt/nickel transport system permease protein
LLQGSFMTTAPATDGGSLCGLLALHAPDGLFSVKVNLAFAVLVATALFAAVRALRRRSDLRLAPLMGIMGAFIFAAQMVNFPIASGTTGHLLGGVLAAVLLGPAAATIVMATVIFFQALLGDGGLTALGPNIFNMGVLGTALGYAVYRTVLGSFLPQTTSGSPDPATSKGGNFAYRPARLIAAAAFASWVAVVLASVCASLQLAASGTVSLNRALPAMVGVHMLIGLGEAIITACIVSFVLRTRPELLFRPQAAPAPALPRGALAFGVGAALVTGTLLSLLPHWWDHPDGLEFVGIQQGFLPEEPETGDDGRLVSLPAYPLGVRLAVVDGCVTAVHRYQASSSPLAIGDVIEQIGTTRIRDLADAVAALAFDAEQNTCGVAAGTMVEVLVRRQGQPLRLHMPALPAPKAAGHRPLVALMPDYEFPGTSGLLGTSLAGAAGTVMMFVVSHLLGWALTRPGQLTKALQSSAER